MTYKYYQDRPATLTKEFASAEYAKLTERIEAAESSTTDDAWLSLYVDWNALNSYLGGELNRLNYAQSKDMSDPVIDETFRYFREQIIPNSEEGESTLAQALLRSKHRDAVANRYGTQLVTKMQAAVKPLAAINSALRIVEGELVNRYNKLISTTAVVVGGSLVTRAVAEGMLTDKDRDVRKEAFLAVRAWFSDHRDEIATIFDELVRVRDVMGKNLGYENFVPLGYLRMGRSDYGPEESKRFRSVVLKYAVPLRKRLVEFHANELGIETLKPWDTGYRPSLTLPIGIAPVANQLDNAQKVFDGLSPRLGAHFARMRNEGLIDLENRKGKMAGAFCTSFSDEGRAAILCNSTGDERDVGILMHEMGHAFQAWESQKIEAVDLQWPTSDAAEIFSMGMEFLSMKGMEHFFSPENAEKVRKKRWLQGIIQICSTCVVDEFQHWVYENPAATLDERDEEYCRIWDIYMEGIDYSGLPKEKAVWWYMVHHIFNTPFYFLDYAIAETAAMQLALMDARDSQRALHTYLRLCEIGGSKSVLEIFASAGMRSPFDETLIRDLMEYAALELRDYL
jgi:M3 family oligoendopeptidase